MKKYIIFGQIKGMGGAQLYVSNKMRYLEERGWSVDVFAEFTDIIKFENLKCFSQNSIPELKYPPSCFNEKRVEEVVQKILSKININNASLIVLETNAPQYAMWGEIVAERLRAKHLAYMLCAVYTHRSKSELDYFAYKLERKELAGIKEDSLVELFGNYRVVKEEEKLFLRAVAINAVSSVSNPVIDKIKKKGFMICYIGSFQKPHLLGMADEVAKFARSYPNNAIQFLLIGGANDTQKKLPSIKTAIEDKFADINNTELIFAGELYPIPRSVFKKVDVCIGSSGSAMVCVFEKVPTILLEDTNHVPLGIIGYTYTKDSHIENVDGKLHKDNIAKLLEDVLVNKICENMPYSPPEYFTNNYNIISEFDKHMSFVDNMPDDRCYYNVKSIKPQGRKVLLTIVLRLFDIKKATYFLCVLNSIRISKFFKTIAKGITKYES